MERDVALSHSSININGANNADNCNSSIISTDKKPSMFALVYIFAIPVVLIDVKDYHVVI